jgi:hypothetical protein
MAKEVNRISICFHYPHPLYSKSKESLYSVLDSKRDAITSGSSRTGQFQDRKCDLLQLDRFPQKEGVYHRQTQAVPISGLLATFTVMRLRLSIDRKTSRPPLRHS